MSTESRKANILSLTKQLRTSDDPIWTGLRRELMKRDLDPQHILVATSFPDDRDFEFGLVVAEDGRVFQYGYSYLDRAEDAGEFTEWSNETERWRSRPNFQDVAIAFELLADKRI